MRDSSFGSASLGMTTVLAALFETQGKRAQAGKQQIPRHSYS